MAKAAEGITRMCGRAIRLGDYVNTDLIFPGAYLNIAEPEEMAKHALEGVSPRFPGRIGKGDIVVGGKNFGCGSSREGAVTSLKHAGVAAVVAKSFGRIFYRNMINQGFLPVECPEAVDMIEDGQEVCIDLEAARVTVGERAFSFHQPPPFIRDVLDAGGLINYTRRQLLGERRGQIG